MTISNLHIDSVYERAISSGALGGKLSGAGGGGYMILYVPAHKRPHVIRAVEGYAGTVVPFTFYPGCVEVWKSVGR